VERVVTVEDEARPVQRSRSSVEPLSWESGIQILTNVYILWDLARAVLIALTI
jgi:hypothetical protein